MSKIGSASDMGFNETFSIVESLDGIRVKLSKQLDEVRFRDFEAILKDPTMTTYQIYMKGFTAVDRLHEEMQQNLKLQNGKK